MISKPPPNPAIPSDPSSAQNFLICKQCGASFTSSKSTTLFCSKRCNNRHYYERNRRKKSDTLLCESQPQSNPTIQTAKVDAQVPKYPSSQSSVELITISEAARRLRVCRQTVYNLIHAGKIHELRFTSRLSYIRWPLSAPPLSSFVLLSSLFAPPKIANRKISNQVPRSLCSLVPRNPRRNGSVRNKRAADIR